MSDAERIIGLIGLIMSPSQDQEIELQDDITPDEFTKHFSGGASLTDAIIASAVSIAYFVFRAFRRIRQCWVKYAPKVLKQGRGLGRKIWLVNITSPMLDWVLLFLLRHRFRRSQKDVSFPLERESGQARSMAMLVYLRGRLFLHQSLYSQACDFLEAAVVWGFAEKNVEFLMGVAAQLAGRMCQAEMAFRYAIETLGPNPQAFLNLGRLLLALGREDEALKFLDSAIKLNPVFSMPHQNLAARYDISKYKPQALDLARYPNVMLYDAYNITGEQLVHIGRGEEGVNCYGKAIHCQRAMSHFANLPTKLKIILERDFRINPEEPIRILPYEWTMQIGHMGMLDTYKKLQFLGMSAPGQPILLAPKHKVANCEYLNLWREHFYVIEDKFLIDALFPYQRFFGDCFNGYITHEGVSRCWTELGAQGHIAWDGRRKEPLIKLTDETRDRGYAALRKFGMKEGDWFVALHVRSLGFYRESKCSTQSHRNAELVDYIRAIKQVTGRGGWVVRMGGANEEPAPKMERVIDCSRSNIKSTWMDVFLAGSAKFFIGTTSGLTNAVISMGVPCLLVNSISSYYQLWNNRVLFTLKPLWLKNEKRFMSISEMADNAFRWKLFNAHLLNKLGAVPCPNTSEEIENATAEMLTRLDGGVIMDETEADEALRACCEVGGNRNYFGNGRLCQSFYQARKADLFAV